MSTTDWRNRIVGYGEEAPDQLVANPRNWRIHPKHQQEALSAALREVGLVQNVIVNKRTGFVIDGHLRVALALRENQEALPVTYVDLDEAEEALILAVLDPIAAIAGADSEKLGALLGELKTSEPHLQSLLDELAKSNGIVMDEPLDDPGPQIDKAKELQEKWGVETGQLWVLGDHRLLCGDATNAADVKRLLDGTVPVLMVTDPPYGVEYDPEWRNRALYANGSLGTGTQRTGAVPNDDRVDWSAAWSLFPGDVAYVWHGGIYTGDVVGHLRSCGFEPRSCLIWRKPRLVISRGHYHWQHEPLWYAVRAGRTARWVGDRKQSTIWDIGRDEDAETIHGTQKPVECMARPMRNHDAPEVYDPFVGSGTSIVAAEQVGRRCFAIDIDPGYVAVSLQRWEDITGQVPKLVNRG